MTDNDRSFAGGNDEDKLIAESSRSSDEQILWLAFAVVAILGLLFFGVSRCGSASDVVDSFTLGGATSELVISDILDDDSSLSITADFFGDGELDSDFSSESAGPFTVFAPTDDAWDNAADTVGVDDADQLLDAMSGEDKEVGIELHVVEGEFTQRQLRDAGTVTTIGGYELTFDDDDLINGLIEFDEADIEASNGIVHKIDGVFPTVEPGVVEPVAEDVEEEVAAAPDPTAVPEPTATPEPEPTATPEPEPTATPEPTPEPAPEPAFTIGDLAGDTPDLSQLTALVGALGLDSTLADPDAGPFTVFAPNNDAFDASAELLSTLSEGDVQTTIGYHVVPGLVPATDIVPGARFDTLSGETLIIGSNGGLPGGINVLTADLETDNGIVHVIDGILVPAPITLRNLTDSIAALEGVRFDVASATIRPESEQTLIDAAAVLRTLPEGTAVEVGGHTDSDGDTDSNQALSEARANSVVAYLVAEGVDPDSLTAVGYGETQLLVSPEETPSDKLANRRIEFTRRG